MIAKIKCRICGIFVECKIPERQSKNKIYYGQIKIDMRGIKTRKYCIQCGLARKKSYKEIKRINTNKQNIHSNTQSSKIERELKILVKSSEYNWLPLSEYRYYICKIYDQVSNKLHVPKATVRRVMFNIRKLETVHLNNG